MYGMKYLGLLRCLEWNSLPLEYGEKGGWVGKGKQDRGRV